MEENGDDFGTAEVHFLVDIWYGNVFVDRKMHLDVKTSNRTETHDEYVSVDEKRS